MYKFIRFHLPVITGILGTVLGFKLATFLFAGDIDLQSLIYVRNSPQTLARPAAVYVNAERSSVDVCADTRCNYPCLNCIALPTGTPLTLKYMDETTTTYSVEFNVRNQARLDTTPTENRGQLARNAVQQTN